MAAEQPIVEVNGKRYDAQSGRLIKIKSVAPVKTHHKTGIHDGMIFAKKSAGVPATALQPKKAADIHQRTLRSKTLVRKAVRRPQLVPSSQSSMDVLPKAAAILNSRFTAGQKHRGGAVHIHKSSKISRFGATLRSPVQNDDTALQAIPVSRPPKKTEHQPRHHIMPSTVSSSTHKQLHAMIDKAMDSATAHHLPPLKKRRRSRMAAMASLSLAGLLLVGFYAYQNIPNAALRVAASRSGVRASMPGYTPSGFAFSGPIKYDHGQLTINYLSHGNSDRRFAITVRSTNWNNQALLSDYVDKDDHQYQTLENKGKVIYILENQTATWLDHGSWYLIEGTANLNSDQLFKIASSI